MYTSSLAEFVSKLKFEDLPERVVEETNWAYLDWLGSALAGSTSEPGKIMHELVVHFGGNPQAALLSDGSKNSVLNAALVNGAISHVVELDDVHKGGIIHAAAGVIPAALAAAEAQGASGSQLITAIVAGYEVAIRIAEAITPSHYKIWHTTGTCCTFGAAAAVGKILGLNKEEMINALGSAGTQASGLWEFITDSAMSKHLHPGKAAFNGALAAYSAQKGFTAAQKILEGDRGFFAATAPEVDYSKLTDGLGDKTSYKISENSYKFHSSCRHTHATLDAVINLRETVQFAPEDIANIEVNTYQVSLDITENYHPTTIYGAKFSLPFCASLGAVKGSAGLDDFTEDNLNDSIIRNMMTKVKLVVDPEIDKLYPGKWPVRVEISLNNGEKYTKIGLYPKGDPENPFTPAEFREKFRQLASLRLQSDETQRLLDSIEKMEQITDVTDLIPSFD